MEEDQPATDCSNGGDACVVSMRLNQTVAWVFRVGLLATASASVG